MKLIQENKCFDGYYQKWEHESPSCKCTMKFSVYLPPGAKDSQQKYPSVYFLSGLTCNEDNFITKAGACEKASELGLILICPDTSPRGTNIPGEHETYDLGSGAGFYVNATQPEWKDHYNMYTYVTKELPQLVNEHLPVNPNKVSIFGHSMGGHGALTIGLKHQDQYKSISAFSPICHPTQCNWGKKALSTYLGDNVEDWKQYDATELIQKVGDKLATPILVHTGSADNFKEELFTEEFTQAIPSSIKNQVEVNIVDGYDHSYWFIQTFIKQHLQFHAKNLN